MIPRTIHLFNQARAELYCPPCRLALEPEGKREVVSPAPLSVLNGVVSLRPGITPEGADPDKCLLWYFRHELAHVHHCPYDIRTAYSLERSAYQAVGRWDLSYLATYIFSDLQVNLNYLPKRFHQIPYPIQVLGSRPPMGLGQMLYEVYKQALPETERPSSGSIAGVAKELYAIVRSNRPWQWHTKVQMIAMILGRLRTQNPDLFSKGRLARYIGSHLVTVREDFYPDSIQMFQDTYGTIPDQDEAREFFKQWIGPRISRKKKEEIEEALRKKIRTRGKKKAGKGRDRRKERLRNLMEGRKPEDELKAGGAGQLIWDEILSKGEPRLPTSLSQPHKKVESQVIDEAFWKRHWYRSRAEKTIIQYLSESPSRRPVWAIMRYPDEWHIEDEIEALDIEMSLDEGSLRPEVTTLKWVKEPTSRGQSVISGFVPSAIIVLDTSHSMSRIHDEAATAAFIAYLSAQKAGGQTSVITFSTKYITADWGDLKETKELVLSMAFDKFTVFPAYEIMDLTSKAAGNCFILVITDGGWQNIDEAVPLIERIADRGHKVFIFQVPGGEYPERIERMKRSPELKFYKVDNPERDLKGLVLSQTMRTYETFLT